MDARDYIWIPRKPRLGLDRPDYRWRSLAYMLTGCAAVTGLILMLLT